MARKAVRKKHDSTKKDENTQHNKETHKKPQGSKGSTKQKKHGYAGPKSSSAGKKSSGKTAKQEKKAAHAHEEPKDENASPFFLIVSVLALLIIIGSIAYYNDALPFLNDGVQDNSSQTPSQEETGSAENELAAEVQGQKITMQELNTQYDSLPVQYKGMVSKESLLESLVNQQLIFAAAQDEGVLIGEDEFSARFDELLAQSGMTKEQLKQNLAQQGRDYQELVDSLMERMTINKYINQTLLPGIEVSEAEIQEHFEQNQEKYLRINASHILLNTSKEAEEIIIELKSGADFGELAREYSIGPSAEKGGLLGVFGKGVMVATFENAAFKLSEGEFTSVPVKTQFGYHVIKVHNKLSDLEDYKGEIEKQLKQQKSETAFEDHVEVLKTTYDVKIYFEPASTYSFEGAQDCLQKYGIGKSDIVFLYSDSCPYCQQVMPVVEELEEEGISFKWVNADQQEALVINECLSSVVNQQATPQFICVESGEVMVGAKGKPALEAFC